MDLWDIVEGSEEPPPFNADSKVLKKYQRRVKKTMSIINFNLADNQLMHIKSCKGHAEAWKTLYNIHETNSLFNIIFICCKFFRARCKRATTFWTTLTRSMCSQITPFVWRYMWEMKTLSWPYLRAWRRHMNTWLSPWRQCPYRILRWTTWRHVWCTRCHSARGRSPTVRMLLWCPNKPKAATYFYAKVQNQVFIVANRATLRVFATNQRTRSANRRWMRRTIMTTHL